MIRYQPGRIPLAVATHADRPPAFPANPSKRLSTASPDTALDGSLPEGLPERTESAMQRSDLLYR